MFKGTPISNNAIYWHKGNVQWVRPEARNWKEYICWEARKQWKGAPWSERLKVSYILYFKNRIRKDLANMEKCTGDALTGVVWEDDSQIDFISFKRAYDKENPRVEITIEKL